MPQALVLVVDDDPQVLALIARMLRSEPIQVVTAPDPLAALKLVAQRAPDLLILDMQLPGVHGLDLVHLLRGTLQTPAIAITGGTVDPDEVQANGFGACILKPFTADQLRRAVREALP